MTTKYADRAFLSMNGARIADVQSASLKQNQNAKAVGTMTPDGFNKDVEDNSGGVGEEVKTTFNFGALRLQDAVGNSSLFNIQL